MKKQEIDERDMEMCLDLARKWVDQVTDENETKQVWAVAKSIAAVCELFNMLESINAVDGHKLPEFLELTTKSPIGEDDTIRSMMAWLEEDDDEY